MKSMTASGGNLIDFILNRKRALPRAVRENCDYSSAVRVRYNASIELADISKAEPLKNGFKGTALKNIEYQHPERC